jgi:hypothetical protein
VTFGAAAATNVVVVSGTQITATTPAGSAGAVTVKVTNLGSQSGSLANGYTYVVATPTAPTGMAVAAGGPGPTYVNGQGYYNTTSLTTHTTATFDSTGGDQILLFASSHQGVTFTPSDSFGNTWISIAGPTSTVTGFDLRSQVWYAPNPKVGSGHTITMNLSLAQPLVMSIVVLKGSNTSSPIDGISLIGSDNGTSSVNVTSPFMTTTGANDLLVGFVKTNGTETFAAGPGFTLQSAATVLNLTAETGLVATAGTYDATFTLSAGVTWESVVGAISNNPNQTSLSWNASTEIGGTISNYLVERCQGAGCANFAQIASTAATGLNDNGLTASTSYSYRVRAEDTTGALGPYSSVVTIVTPAPIPALPGNLMATVAAGTQIDLSWAASTETGGTVNKYLVQRCQGAGCANFTQIATSATTTYNDTGLVAGASYSYRVQASDTAGNLSPFSNMASASVVLTVGSLLPISGATAGGTAVTITGTHFAAGATVMFGAAAATNVVVVSGTQITATTPAGSAGTVTVTVTDPGALSGSLTNGYTYLAPPAVSSVAPNNGPVAGGTAVTITGTNFAAGATVTIGGPAATNVVVVNSTTITATTPAGNAGLVAVTVTVNGQSGSLANGFTYTGTVAISFSQVASATPQSPTATVAVGYPAAQTARNLNVVVVGWNDTSATVQSVKDTAGNSYILAIGPTSGTALRQSIYYASGIVGGSNTVTVTFSQAAVYPDIRILEYRGVTALDVTAGASGSSTAANSGAATTTSANELIFGANTVSTLNGTAGSGFTTRIITSPDSDLAEDKIVTAAGSNSATATLTGSGPWVMQMVTFK